MLLQKIDSNSEFFFIAILFAMNTYINLKIIFKWISELSNEYIVFYMYLLESENSFQLLNI